MKNLKTCLFSLFLQLPVLFFAQVSTLGCADMNACNYTPQGLSPEQYLDSLGYSISSLIAMGYDSNNLLGQEYGGGVIYDLVDQDSNLTIYIVHPPEYADAPVPNMGLDPGSPCGAGGQFGGSFLNAPEACEALVLEGLDDWSLPSIEQVEQVYHNLFYSPLYPVNVCATGNLGYFKGIDYLSSTETCRCYFGTGVIACDAPASNAYEYFPVREESVVIPTGEFECVYPSYQTEIETACDSLTWLDGITYTSSTNLPSIALTNAVGCDSIVTLDLTVNYTTYNTIDTMAVNVFEYEGVEYTEGGEFTIVLDNAAGCDSVVTLKLDLEYVGVEESLAAESWSLYPNPVTNQLSIDLSKWEGAFSVLLTNALGQVVWEQPVQGIATIDVSAYARGLYTVEVLGLTTRERRTVILR
jgi:hypothetical protein